MSRTVEVRILDHWQDKGGRHSLTVDAAGRVRYHTEGVGFWHAIPVSRHAQLAAECHRLQRAVADVGKAAVLTLGADHPVTQQLLGVVP